MVSTADPARPVSRFRAQGMAGRGDGCGLPHHGDTSN